MLDMGAECYCDEIPVPIDAAEAVFSGLKQLADAALRVYAATVTPRVGSLDYSPEQERERSRLNEMIRNGDCFDKIIDFAAATADGRNPAILAPCCDSGDHLHPSALGREKMAGCAYSVLAQILNSRKNANRRQTI